MNDLSKQSQTFLQGRGIHSAWESDYLNPDIQHILP